MDDLKDTVKNFFENRCSRHEYFSICRQFEKEKPSKLFLEELEEEWNEIKTDKSTGFNQKFTWDKIVRRIGNSANLSGSSVNLWNFIQKAAAVLLLPLLITSIFLFISENRESDKNGWVDIQCPVGVRTEFQLPDGSTGFLNSNSSLKYPVNFTENRVIDLTGEAFFDVVKSEGKTFCVKTGKLKVEVLGTSFNIRAYQGQNEEEITLRRGRLRILNKASKELVVLVPDQQFILDKEQNKFRTRDVDAYSYMAWIEGKLVIEGERFEEVAKRLSQWYGIEIGIEDEKLKDFVYYATFENEPLNEVLRLISLTAPIKYSEEARRRDAGGNFSKRKIKFTIDQKRIKDFN